MTDTSVFHHAINDKHLPRHYCNKFKKYQQRKHTCEIDEPIFDQSQHVFGMANYLYGISYNNAFCLKNLVTEIYYPFDTGYDHYRKNYNHRFNCYPLAIVRVHHKSDILNTLRFCQEFRIPFRIRCGAHCYEPASIMSYGIIIDQRPRDKIVKIKNGTAKIQAGALLGPVVKELAKNNLAIPFGTCFGNGMSGLSLGGGIGFFTREYGLTLDNIVDMKVILANGQIVHANNDKYCDLFWVLRGAGGGNFGIVTDFTYRTKKIDYVTVFTINYKFDDTKEVFKCWQCWSPYTDSKLTTEMDIFNRYQPVIITGQLLPTIDPDYDKKILFEFIQPLLDLNLHTDLTIKSMSLSEAAAYFDGNSHKRPKYFYNKSDFNFEPLCDDAIDTIIIYMGMLDKSQSFHKTEIDALGGNFAKIPSDATAFSSRSAIQWFQYTSLWHHPCEEKANMKWMNKYYKALRPYFPKNKKYINALDYNAPLDRALESYYGENLPTLIEIKQKYDPYNVFNFQQSIPLLCN